MMAGYLWGGTSPHLHHQSPAHQICPAELLSARAARAGIWQGMPVFETIFAQWYLLTKHILPPGFLYVIAKGLEWCIPVCNSQHNICSARPFAAHMARHEWSYLLILNSTIARQEMHTWFVLGLHAPPQHHLRFYAYSQQWSPQCLKTVFAFEGETP